MHRGRGGQAVELKFSCAAGRAYRRWFEPLNLCESLENFTGGMALVIRCHRCNQHLDVDHSCAGWRVASAGTKRTGPMPTRAWPGDATAMVESRGCCGAACRHVGICTRSGAGNFCSCARWAWIARCTRWSRTQRTSCDRVAIPDRAVRAFSLSVSKKSQCKHQRVLRESESVQRVRDSFRINFYPPHIYRTQRRVLNGCMDGLRLRLLVSGT